MGRKVVFFGNCQAEALSRLYRDHLSDDDDDIKLVYFQREGDGDIGVLQDADIVIEQVSGGLNDIVSNNISPDCIRAPYPMAIGAYFWPFALGDHIHNRIYPTAPHLPGGPWPAENGDLYLNRLIAQNAPVEEAVRAYLALDIAAHADLDRLTELHLGSQRRRDDITGIELTGIIEANFRTERLFLSRGHPDIRLFTAQAVGVFQKCGYSSAAIEAAVERLPHSYHGNDLMPMHPRLIEHYRLDWCDPGMVYQDLWWGPMTFEDWVRRYMTYDWNQTLHEGIYYSGVAGGPDPLPHLEQGVEHAPNSILGLRSLAELYYGRGRIAEAQSALYRAARLDPGEPLRRLAEMLRQRGNSEQAEAMLRSGVERVPKDAGNHFALAGLLAEQGRSDEAIASTEHGAALLPRQRLESFLEVGYALLRANAIAGAEIAFHNALSVDASNCDALFGLAESLKQNGRTDAAATTLMSLATAIDGTTGISLDAGQLRRLGWMFRHLPDLRMAEAVFRRAIDTDPNHDNARIGLVNTLNALGRQDESLTILRNMVAADSKDPETYLYLALMMREQSDLESAETLVVQAIHLAPHWHELGDTLAGIQRERQNLGGESLPARH